MDNKQFIIEIIKYAGWPSVIILAIFVLKDKVSSLFGGGLKSAKHGSSEVQFYEVHQEVKPSTPDNQNLQHLIPVDPTGLREELEKKIEGQLSKLSCANTDKIDVLIKNLAQQQITNAFERVYHSIFGSQIRLLEFLSVQEDGKSTTSKIVNFFDTAKENAPETFENTEFSDYMNFLISWELVQNIEENWLITKKGRAFITYITAMKFDKNKML